MPFTCDQTRVELLALLQQRVTVLPLTLTVKSHRTRLGACEEIRTPSITKERWASCVMHAEQLQDEDFRKEIAREYILKPIVIDLAED
ncbi:hypothetical protein J437_LFUL015729 [Ladona fulva]|uniref:Uncharacterized protein n=1 Tax=Ladona fulva TaxID=123851 RepID=A0A8K0KI89_LADFU|nr:hypothetical protein J437_LFUL015729 [Ladona fulva]